MTNAILQIGEAEINETVSVLRDLFLNIILPEEIILAVKSANSLNTPTT